MWVYFLLFAGSAAIIALIVVYIANKVIIAMENDREKQRKKQRKNKPKNNNKGEKNNG